MQCSHQKDAIKKSTKDFLSLNLSILTGQSFAAAGV
jgi:hypothetical protein